MTKENTSSLVCPSLHLYLSNALGPGVRDVKAEEERGRASLLPASANRAPAMQAECWGCPG